MNYKKLIKDFNNGSIDKSKWKLIIDNDDGYWTYLGEVSEDKEEELIDEMEKKYGRPSGYQDIVDILKCAGVNAEWC